MAQATRASIEKARGLKMFKGNGKTPSESGDYGHKRNVSAASEAGRGDNGRGSIAASDYGVRWLCDKAIIDNLIPMPIFRTQTLKT